VLLAGVAEKLIDPRVRCSAAISSPGLELVARSGVVFRAVPCSTSWRHPQPAADGGSHGFNCTLGIADGFGRCWDRHRCSALRGRHALTRRHRSRLCETLKCKSTSPRNTVCSNPEPSSEWRRSFERSKKVSKHGEQKPGIRRLAQLGARVTTAFSMRDISPLLMAGSRQRVFCLGSTVFGQADESAARAKGPTAHLVHVGDQRKRAIRRARRRWRVQPRGIIRYLAIAPAPRCLCLGRPLARVLG